MNKPYTQTLTYRIENGPALYIIHGNFGPTGTFPVPTFDVEGKECFSIHSQSGEVFAAGGNKIIREVEDIHAVSGC